MSNFSVHFSLTVIGFIHDCFEILFLLLEFIRPHFTLIHCYSGLTEINYKELNELYAKHKNQGISL